MCVFYVRAVVLVSFALVALSCRCRCCCSCYWMEALNNTRHIWNWLMLFSSDLVAVPNGTLYLSLSRYGSVFSYASTRRSCDLRHTLSGVFLPFLFNPYPNNRRKTKIKRKSYFEWNAIKLCNNFRQKRERKNQMTKDREANVKSETTVFSVYVKWSLVVIQNKATQRRARDNKNGAIQVCFVRMCLCCACFVSLIPRKKRMVFTICRLMS